MDEIGYLQYVLDSKKAEELHAVIDRLSKEEKWADTHPGAVISSRTLHMYAYVNGLITQDEYFLLCRFF